MASKRRPYEDTTVSADQSKAEIRTILLRYGADQFGIMEEAGRAVICFQERERLIRVEVPLPDRREPALTKAGKVLRAGTPAALSVHDQEERRLWRAVRCWIFGQMEAIESGIRTFEEIWLADTVLPDGQRFAQWAETELQREISAGRMPALLGSPAPSSR